MKVTQVAVRPTEASYAAGRPALTPELLAASGARYSRNNEGLEAILEKIDPDNLDKSVDSIFKMIDYGHQSIADMVPVSMFIDGISIWLAYYVWSLCPTAGGQESSTRYIKMDVDELIPPAILGITREDYGDWHTLMRSCFDTYLAAIRMWESIVTDEPNLARIPKSLLEDDSEKTQKQVARMKRNFAFDRARYFLPVAAGTNMMLVMSARGWVQLCQYLLSHYVREARELGLAIRAELDLAAPRMLKHAEHKASYSAGLIDEFNHMRNMAVAQPLPYPNHIDGGESPAHASLEVMLPPDCDPIELTTDLRFHDNRYAWMGSQLRRTSVRFGWHAVSLAEIRDLNRHRTGSKYCPLVPAGFYCAADALPPRKSADSYSAELANLAKTGVKSLQAAHKKLAEGQHSYIYWSTLGTQYKFEHVTTADKFIYEAELRTGTGAHFRYAKHLRDALNLWYIHFPATRGLILEGSAEPE
jgi:thymidylate synthase ThyX